MPCISRLHSLVININPAIINPTNPQNSEKKIKMNRHNLVAFTKSISVYKRPHIAVMATIITTIGDIIPAATAASPSTNAPTILMADPIALGILISLSHKISKVVINMITSKAVGKGTPSL